MGLKMLGELVSMVVSGFDKTRSVHVNSLLVDPMFTLITNFGNYVPNLLLSNMNEGAHARMLLVSIHSDCFTPRNLSIHSDCFTPSNLSIHSDCFTPRNFSVPEISALL